MRDDLEKIRDREDVRPASPEEERSIRAGMANERVKELRQGREEKNSGKDVKNGKNTQREFSG